MGGDVLEGKVGRIYMPKQDVGGMALRKMKVGGWAGGLVDGWMGLWAGGPAGGQAGVSRGRLGAGQSGQEKVARRGWRGERWYLLVEGAPGLLRRGGRGLVSDTQLGQVCWATGLQYNLHMSVASMTHGGPGRRLGGARGRHALDSTLVSAQVEPRRLPQQGLKRERREAAEASAAAKKRKAGATEAEGGE